MVSSHPKRQFCTPWRFGTIGRERKDAFLAWETRLEARLYAALPRSFLYTSKLFDWVCNEASQLSSVSLIKFGIGGPTTTQGTQSILGPLNTAKFEKISGKQYFMHISTEEYIFLMFHVKEIVGTCHCFLYA